MELKKFNEHKLLTELCLHKKNITLIGEKTDLEKFPNIKDFIEFTVSDGKLNLHIEEKSFERVYKIRNDLFPSIFDKYCFKPIEKNHVLYKNGRISIALGNIIHENTDAISSNYFFLL